MKETKTYTPQQLAGAERAVKILLAMPKDTREIATMVANAFVDGLKAGQELRKEAPSEVLTD